MAVHVRKRFWSEVVLGTVSAVLLLLTIVWPDWIEVLFGVAPDGGSGELEWGIAALFALSTIMFSVMVRSEWRRAAASASDQGISG